MKARRVFAVAIFAAAALFPLLQTSPASAASPGDFVASINNLRASKGLGTLAVDGGLSAVAQRWANQMAAAGSISHNPNLSGSVGGSWTKLGENVGVGGDVNSLMTAFINSPGHYRNLVDASFNRVGVGVAVGSDGRIYTTHDFASYPNSGGSAPRAAAPAPTRAPAPARAPASSGSRAAAPATSAPAASGASQPVATAAAPAAAVPAGATPADSPATVVPGPSGRIVAGLAEIASLATQG